MALPVRILVPTFVEGGVNIGDLETLEYSIRRRIEQLEYTQQELQTYLSTSEDADFREALEENEPILEESKIQRQQVLDMLAAQRGAFAAGVSVAWIGEEGAEENIPGSRNFALTQLNNTNNAHNASINGGISRTEEAKDATVHAPSEEEGVFL